MKIKSRIMTLVLLLALLLTFSVAPKTFNSYKLNASVKKINNEVNTIYVSNTGTSDADGTRLKPYNSLTTAINMAQDGEIIYLLSNMDLNSTLEITKKITLASTEGQNYTLTWKETLDWGFIIYGDGDLTVQNITLDDTANALSLGFFQVDGSKLTIADGAIIQNNQSTWMGGAIHASNATITMTGGLIKNNSGNPSGAIGLENNTNFTMTGGEISGNTSASGGAIWASNSIIKLSGSATIKNNNASDIGGAITLDHSTLEIAGNTLITGNTSNGQGGSICAYNDSTINMNGGFVSNNKATDDGGAFHLSKSVLNAFGGEISGNEVTTGIKNSANYRGGAVLAYNDSIVNLKNNIVLKNNKAVRGGAIYITENTTLNMDNGTITNNTATANAGAIHIAYQNDKPSQATISGGNITNNKNTGTDIDTSLVSDTEFAGGAIYNGEGCTLNLKNVIVTNNSISQEMFIAGRDSDKGIFAGGIGVCPESKVFINGLESSAIYGNRANGGADILLVTETSIFQNRHPSLYVSYLSLGDGLYHWTDLDGNYIAGGQIDTSKKFVTLVSNLSNDDIEKAKKEATTMISENSSNGIYGAGAIMSNGILNIGRVETTGGLSVTKKITGKNANLNREFTITVTLSEKISGQYGDMNFEDGVATFKIKANETISAKLLPEGLDYTVVESDNSGYKVNYVNNEGKITKGTLSIVEVNNTLIEENVLPNTGDNIMKYFSLSIISFTIMIILASRLKKQKM